MYLDDTTFTPHGSGVRHIKATAPPPKAKLGPSLRPGGGLACGGGVPYIEECVCKSENSFETRGVNEPVRLCIGPVVECAHRVLAPAEHPRHFTFFHFRQCCARGWAGVATLGQACSTCRRFQKRVVANLRVETFVRHQRDYRTPSFRTRRALLSVNIFRFSGRAGGVAGSSPGDAPGKRSQASPF